MGVRSRRRRARYAWILTLVVPLLRRARAWLLALRPEAAWRLGLRAGALLDRFAPGAAHVRENLSVALGRPPRPEELARLKRADWEHFALLFLETLRSPLITAGNAHEYFAAEGLARARRLRQEEPGALIVVTGHTGPFPLLGHLGGLLGFKPVSLSKLSGHPDLDAFVQETLGASGQRVISATGALWPLKKALDRGESAGINVDQQAREDPVFVPFLGVLCASSQTPAALHLRTRAPIVVAWVERRGRFRYALHIEDVIRHPPGPDKAQDVLAITARLNAGLEAAIRRAPEQWFWSHRRFRRRPPGERELVRIAGVPPLELEPRGG